MELDLCSRKSIESFADQVKKRISCIDVLLHNAGFGAGMLFLPKAKDFENMDVTLCTNFYGPILLTYLLLDLIKLSAPSRIIFVSSVMHNIGLIRQIPPVYEATFGSPLYVYGKSKLAISMACLDLARRLYGTGVTVNCLHPGIVSTNIWRNIKLPNFIIDIIKKLFFISIREGVTTIIYCVTSPQLSNITGKYFVDCQEAPLADKALDIEKNKNLLDNCKQFLGIEYDDENGNQIFKKL